MMKTNFEGKEYVLVTYENKVLTKTDADTLDYISETLYGDISFQMRCVLDVANPKVEQYIRSVKYNNPTNKWNHYQILDQNLCFMHPCMTESKGEIGYTFNFPKYFLKDYHLSLTENNFLCLCYKCNRKFDSLRIYIEDSSSILGKDNKRICYEFEENNSNVLEVGAFSLYENGIKFFPNTRMALLFQDQYL